MKAPTPPVLILPTAPRPSRRVRRVAALLGVGLRAAPLRSLSDSAHVQDLARALAHALAHDRALVLVTGASGAGKTRLLRAVRRELRSLGTPTRAVDCARGRLPARGCVADALPGPLASVLATLGSAGLSDARVLAAPVRALSAGEAARLRLARAMHAAAARRAGCPLRPPCVLLADEVGSLLDALTARALLRGLSRWARREGVGVLACSSTEQAPAWFGAHRVIDLDRPLPPAPHAHRRVS